jgi:hypothetical protein
MRLPSVPEAADREQRMAGETIRLEEYQGLIQSKLVAVWHSAEAGIPWLPTEFLLSQYITRILVTGRASPLSTALASDPSWTQVWRSPGAKEWGCLLSVLQYMPGPVLVVVGPDMVLTPKLVGNLQGARSAPAVTVCVLRVAGGAGWAGDPPDHVFFPVVDGVNARSAVTVGLMQEWMGRATPRSLDLKTLLPQLAAQGYALTVADGAWHWYKPADSAGLATLTVPQIARQLQILGAVLEKVVL